MANDYFQRVHSRTHTRFWKNNPTAAELIARDPQIDSRIDLPTNPETVEELKASLPGFRRAWDEDGLAPREFADYGPVMLFKTMFLNGWSRLLDEIADRRARSG